MTLGNNLNENNCNRDTALQEVMFDDCSGQ